MTGLRILDVGIVIHWSLNKSFICGVQPLSAMRRTWHVALTLEAAGHDERATAYFSRACDIAVRAAPYCHARVRARPTASDRTQALRVIYA